MKIAASLMCANLLNMQQDIELLENAGIDLWHVDIMDGNFVPNFAMNFDTIKAVQEISNIPIEAHYMGYNFEHYIGEFAQAGVEYLSFHIETTNNPGRILNQIRKQGMKSGLAISPLTVVDNLGFFLDRLDYILIMTVEPGFAGQKFMEPMLTKISKLATLIEERNCDIEIGVDGNINVENARKALEFGADILVAGTSSIFNNGDLVSNLIKFKREILS